MNSFQVPRNLLPQIWECPGLQQSSSGQPAVIGQSCDCDPISRRGFSQGECREPSPQAFWGSIRQTGKRNLGGADSRRETGGGSNSSGWTEWRLDKAEPLCLEHRELLPSLSQLHLGLIFSWISSSPGSHLLLSYPCRGRSISGPTSKDPTWVRQTKFIGSSTMVQSICCLFFFSRAFSTYVSPVCPQVHSCSPLVTGSLLCLSHRGLLLWCLDHPLLTSLRYNNIPGLLSWMGLEKVGFLSP